MKITPEIIPAYEGGECDCNECKAFRERNGIPRAPAQDKEGAPRSRLLPADPAARKTYPLATGLFDYFPDALTAVANVSYVGNEQHNPGQPLHWARGKSTDEADTMLRHFLERGTRDKDGLGHTAKFVWRALAYLQKELEEEFHLSLPRSARLP